MVFEIETERDMHLLGERLGKRLFDGSFVALFGDLGAGKTALSQGVGWALGVFKMQSPTFMIVKEYDTRPKLYHFDAYRLSDSDELYAMGFSDYEDGIILMEWANLVEDALPASRLDVFLEGSGEAKRSVRFEAHGKRYEEILRSL
ncbi:MAG: tRNA (adenosine(37)-N6)-threonylcarbamoyltransferase complex ATPase subunit type 1 TsaE [Clostridia bacterium]|nr:tRNA (adenosine(37)-N6)-threonylcarbamoyltransferase complex ATPase subunit type 1 TsaE [Clostridia bacterium]